jgi:uroporphyrinogen decarboxylase
MDSKERFQAACAHRAPDRPPVDYLAHRETDRKLREHFGVGSERELLDRLGSDFYYLSCRDISQNETCAPFFKKPLPMTEKERTCPLGIRWHRSPWNAKGEGQRGDGKTPTAKFTVDEAIRGPLAGVESEKEVLAYPWPKASDFDFSALAMEWEANHNRVVIGGLWTGIMGDAYRMMGFEDFLVTCAGEPEVVKTLVRRLTDLYLELNEAIFAQMKGKMDVWFFGNDFGSQEGLLIGKEMWTEIFYENIRRLTAHAHGYGLKVMMHSCGSIAELIPQLIEAGVDILDPIQVTAKGMEIGGLKERFGDRLVFHGAVDTQRVLPRGTAREVREHGAETTRVLGKDGGFIYAPSQILQADVPMGNIEAMYGVGEK